MSKKLLLVLDDDVHSALKEHQMDRITETRKQVSLNKLLNEIVRAGTHRLSDNATDILERAAAKKADKTI
jgi:hypothetical protein